jgi:thiamine biosynthesis protein ThiS
VDSVFFIWSEKMLNLTVNGKERTFESSDSPETLKNLLEQLNIKAATIVAEIDGKIIERKEFENTQLANGQKIELIRFMGGG